MGGFEIDVTVRNDNFDVKPFAKTAARALEETVYALAALIDDKCRQQIASSGKFGGEWVSGLTATTQRTGDGYDIRVEHSLGPMVRPHVYGATIYGRPLLWIPFSDVPEARNVYARDYPGKLFRVDRKSGPPP